MSNTEKVKICPTCLLEKSYDDYNKDGSKSNGIDSYCKECKSKLTKEQRIRKKNNMEYETKQQKECGKCNKTLDVANFTKNCYSKDGLKTMCKQCYSSTRKKTKEVSQTYDYTCSIQEKCCRNCLEVKHIDQFPKNRKSQDCHSYICIKCQPQNNHTREKQYQYEKRYYEKPGVKMYRALRNSQNKRIREELLNFGAQKSKRTIQYLGCTIEFLKHWFDFQLARKQLSWDTYGEWEIDHVIPCKSFDLSKDENIQACFNWTNLQPLTATENKSKSDRIIPDMIQRHAQLVEMFQQSFSAENKEGELRETPKETSTNPEW